MQTKIKNVIKFHYSKIQNIISQWWIKWIQPFMQESYDYMICEFEDNLIVCFCYLFKPGGLDVETNRDRDRERP